MTVQSYEPPAYDGVALQMAADYRAVKKSLRSAGIFSAANGLIFMSLAFNAFAHNPLLASILLIIGLVMIAESICTFIGPSPVLFIIDGIAIGCVGLLILGVMALTLLLHTARGGIIYFGLLGSFQIMAAINGFKRYQRFASTPMHVPPAELYNYIDSIARGISKQDPKSRPDMIQLLVTTFPVQSWKVHLTGEHAIFVDARNHEVLFTLKSDVDLQTITTTAQNMKGRLRIRDRWLQVAFPAEYLRRFTQWKSSL